MRGLRDWLEDAQGTLGRPLDLDEQAILAGCWLRAWKGMRLLERLSDEVRSPAPPLDDPDGGRRGD